MKISKPFIALISLIGCISPSFAADHAYCPIGASCYEGSTNYTSDAPGQATNTGTPYSLKMGVERENTRNMYLQCLSSDGTTTYPPAKAKVSCSSSQLVCGIDGLDNPEDNAKTTKIHCRNEGNTDHHFHVEELECDATKTSGLDTEITSHSGCGWENPSSGGDDDSVYVP